MSLQMSGILEEGARWLCAGVFFGALIGILMWFTRRPAVTEPRTTCRRCGYDVRQTPERCPECGATVPDEIRLRLALLGDNPPAFLLDDEHALPLRDPGEEEAFRPLVLMQDKDQQQRLTTLLRRAGIASEVDVRLMPPYARRMFHPGGGDPDKPRFEVSVPDADYPVAMELLAYVARTAGEEPAPATDTDTRGAT